jgi:hypothetical protein
MSTSRSAPIPNVQPALADAPDDDSSSSSSSNSHDDAEEASYETMLFGPSITFFHFRLEEKSFSIPISLDDEAVCKRVEAYQRAVRLSTHHRYLIYLAWLSDLHQNLEGDELITHESTFIDEESKNKREEAEFSWRIACSSLFTLKSLSRRWGR